MFANAPKVGNKCHLQLGTGSSCVFTCTLFEHLCVCVRMLYGYVRMCVCVLGEPIDMPHSLLYLT